MNRRDFLKAVGVATGGAMVAGCEPKKGTHKAIAPLFPPPDGILPGEPYHLRPHARGPAVSGITPHCRWSAHQAGGHSGHPVNDGALCARGQDRYRALQSAPQRSRCGKDGSGWKESSGKRPMTRFPRGARGKGERQKELLSLRRTTVPFRAE